MSQRALGGVRSQPDQLDASGGEHQGLAGGDDHHDVVDDVDVDADDDHDHPKEWLPVQCLKLVRQVF